LGWELIEKLHQFF
jgi:hypothetical protein